MRKSVVVMGAFGALASSVAAAGLPAVGAAAEGAAREEARVLIKEVVIQAPLEAVWAAWTTEEGLAPVSPESRIELEPGGDYAWFLQLEPDPQGRRGSEGSRVVAFVPRESITFDWTFSPATPRLRAEGATTRVEVSFEPVGEEGVRVRLVAGGWQEGEEWELGYGYFERAWGWVLQEMKRHLEGASTQTEALSFTGAPLHRPALDEGFVAEQERLRSEAEERVAASPEQLEEWIWWGRRTAYLGRYREAIEIYTRALKRFPDDPRLLRHRGHRYLTVRDLDAARADFERAAARFAELPDEIEPDGLPNERNQPTSSLHTNTWYHLGLAYYVAGDFASARHAFERCLAAARYDDMAVATRYWLALSQARLDDREGLAANLAAVDEDLDVFENRDYLALLLHFKGERAGEALWEVARSGGGLSAATVGYGVGAWKLVEGDEEGARSRFREVVDIGPWPAFGALAAEAELARAAPSH